MNDPCMLARELMQIMAITGKQWVIFLNARETPGSTDSDEWSNLKSRIEKEPNGWMDGDEPGGAALADESMSQSEENAPNKTGRLDEFLATLTTACEPGSCSAQMACGVGPCAANITVVLITRRDKEDLSVLESRMSKLSGEESVLLEHSIRPDEKLLIERAIKWTGEDARRKKFLFNLTLPRRTRYLAMIWDEAVLPPANPSPNDGSDGPLEWIESLELNGLLRVKHGGLLWFHTLARIQLRDQLRNERVEGQKLEATEPSSHWKIALWYQKVLASTHDPSAVFESVYHACMSVAATLRLRCASTGGIHSDGVLGEQVLGRIRWASALLRTYSHLIQTQGYSLEVIRRLRYLRDNLCGKIAMMAPQDEEVNKSLQDVLKFLGARCTEIMRAVAREVGDVELAYLMSAELRNNYKGHASIIEGKGFDEQGTVEAGLIEFLRDKRWEGMIGIASRSYPDAYRAFAEGLAAMQTHGSGSNTNATMVEEGRISEETFKNAVNEIVEILSNGKVKHRDGECASHHISQRLRLEVIRILEQVLLQELLDISLFDRIQLLGQDSQAEYRPRLSRKIVDSIKRLTDIVIASDSSSDSRDSVLAYWTLSRTLMHEAAFAAYAGRHADAMRLLNDSQAALIVHDARRRGIDRVIIDLHRAEVTMLQARMQNIAPEPTNPFPFRKFMYDNAIISKLHSGKARNLVGSLDSRAVSSLIGDTRSFLDMAERGLSSSRRGSWWTTWLLQRRLSLIAMATWSSILDKDSPIPYFGHEAAPRGTMLEADRILDTAFRLIKFDSYRFATIVEAYAKCVEGLSLRLRRNDEGKEMRVRLAMLSDRLGQAVKRLSEIQDSRDTAVEVQGKVLKRLDDQVGVYIDLVRSYAQEIQSQVRPV
jgi:hypothetical protein